MKCTFLIGVLLLSLAYPAASPARTPAADRLDASSSAQKQKKTKEQSREDKKAAEAAANVPRLADDQAIEMAIGEMLGAWQIGDVEMLHKYFADDVMVVSGAWEPPLVGWANYLQAYQRQRARTTGARLDRHNTYVHVQGNFAWAAYQWDFNAVVDGQPSSARGHTTLVLEKRNNRWLIVHNHTSVVPEGQVPQPAPPAGAQKPPAAAGAATEAKLPAASTARS